MNATVALSAIAGGVRSQACRPCHRREVRHRAARRAGFAVAVAMLASIATSGHAALVTYTTQVINDPSDTSWVSPANTVPLSAFNFGGDQTTYGGVTWSDSTNVNGWGAGNPDVTPYANFSQPGVTWGNNVSAFFSSGPDLLNAGSYLGSSSGQVDLGNFTAGKRYLVQFVLADNRNAGGSGGQNDLPGRTITIQGLGNQTGQNSATVQYAYGDSRFAVVTADFVADTTNFSFRPLVGDGSPGTQINAVQVLELVPEPSTASMAAVGAMATLAMMARKLRRKA